MEKLSIEEVEKDCLNYMLLSHYIWERMFATFVWNELRGWASCVENWNIVGVDKKLLLAQFSWVKSWWIINEISSLNVDKIDDLMRYEIKRYERILFSRWHLVSSNWMDIISYLAYLRDLLHNKLWIWFAMDILPVSENIRDCFSIHKRNFLDVNVDSLFLWKILWIIERIELSSNIEDIKDLIFDILSIYSKKTWWAICWVVFNNWNCISSCKKGFEKLLVQYEKRMAYNKQRLWNWKLWYSFWFAQYSWLKANDITISHNKVWHSWVWSFIKSPFHSSSNNLFNSSDFRVFWWDLVDISLEVVELNNIIWKLLANVISVKEPTLINMLTSENISRIT